MDKKICGVVAVAILLPITASARQHDHKGQSKTTAREEVRLDMHSGMMNMDHSGMMNMDHSGTMNGADHSGSMGSPVERATMNVFFLPAVVERLDLTAVQAGRLAELAADVAMLVEEGPGELATLGDDPTTSDVREYFGRQADLRAEIFDRARTMLNVLTPTQQELYAAIDMKEMHAAVMASDSHTTMMALMSQLGCSGMSMDSMPMIQAEADSTKRAMHGGMSHEKKDPR